MLLILEAQEEQRSRCDENFFHYPQDFTFAQAVSLRFVNLNVAAFSSFARCKKEATCKDPFHSFLEFSGFVEQVLRGVNLNTSMAERISLYKEYRTNTRESTYSSRNETPSPVVSARIQRIILDLPYGTKDAIPYRSRDFFFRSRHVKKSKTAENVLEEENQTFRTAT